MGVVVHSVDALRYKPENRVFDFGIFHSHKPFIRTIALRSTQSLAEMSTRNVPGGRCVGLTTLPPSCADCLEICEPQPPRTVQTCTRIALPLEGHCDKHV